jgi:hypothetical protein
VPSWRISFAKIPTSRSSCDASLRCHPLPLSPDHEARALAATRRRLHGFPWLLFIAMFLSMSAFGRIVSDTSWDVSPRNFIIVASMAAACWSAYFVSLWRMRARILIVPARKGWARDRKTGD